MDNYFVRPEAIERIAKGYSETPNEISQITPEQIRKFRMFTLILFIKIHRFIEFVDYEPYEYNIIDPVRKDWLADTLKVNTTGNNSELWGPFYNLLFRAIHDYIHVIYKLDFNFEDEVTAYEEQIKFSLFSKPKDWTDEDVNIFKKVLRSEIIYQAAVKTFYGEFHLEEQKIILSNL